MYYQERGKIFKKICIFILLISAQLSFPYNYYAEQAAPQNNPPNTQAPQNNPSEGENSQANTENNAPTPTEQSPEQPPQQPPPPAVQNENPSVKSKKVPAKKSTQQPKKETVQKQEAENKDAVKEKEDKKENKVILPEVLPEEVLPPSNTQSSTYDTEQQQNSFVKGVIAWVFIAIGIAIIGFVIWSNRKIPKDSLPLFEGKHDLKSKLKNSRNYGKNIRRK